MSLKIVFALWIGLSGAAIAQTTTSSEAIPTAGGGPESVAPSQTSTAPILLPDRYDLGSNIVRSVGPCGAPPKADGKPDRSPHGEVFAGVGNHGYREGGGIVCVPIGDTFSATVAVDAGTINDRGRRH